MGDTSSSTKSIAEKDRTTGGMILLGSGIVFLLNNFDVLDLSEGWPLILVVIGVALIAGRSRRHRKAPEDRPHVCS